MFQIEKGIPIVRARVGRKTGRLREKLLEMEINDSFLVEKHEPEFKCLRGSVTVISKKIGRKFTVAVVEGGLRVWRIE